MSSSAHWRTTTVVEALEEHGDRAGERSTLPLLSITKARGMVLASERFKKGLHSDDLSRYRVAHRNEFVVDPMLLWDGQIARQRVVDAGLVSPDYRVYRIREGVDPGFLEYLLRGPTMKTRYRVTARGTNVRRSRISRDDFLALPIRLPILAEQQKIAAILSSVDEVIEKTDAVIAQLQVVKKAMTQELLTRGLPGRHTRSTMTEIGEMPEGWSLARLEDVAQVQTGMAKGKQIQAADAVEVPYLRVANVQDGYVDLSEMKTLVVERGALQRYGLRRGDVLFTEGGDADKLGRGCVWRGQIEPCLHQNHVFVVRPDPGWVLPEFLAQYAASTRGKAYFLDCAKQTTNLASINSSQLRAMPIPVPPPDEQDEIVRTLASIDNRLEAERGVLATQHALKTAVSGALLSGDVRVNVDQEVAA